MTAGKEIETRGHILGFTEEIDKVAVQGKEAFFSWFDSNKDAETAFIRGNWDFLYHIASPVTPYIKQPEEKTVLEIGYGGGRILTSACRYFKNAIGIDVHTQSKLVSTEMLNRGVFNFQLLQTNGKTIPLQDNSIDFVFSFIVLMHVETIEIFKGYFQETYRILKPDSIALLYFERQYTHSNNTKSKMLYWLDSFREYYEYRILRRKGYFEILARVNAPNLFVALPLAVDIAHDAGFEILGKVVSRKKVPDGTAFYGRQHGLILRKNK